LITGLLSNRASAYGIARRCHAQGAELAFTYQNDRFRDRVTEKAAEFGSTIVLPCDVAEDSQIDGVFESLRAHWDGLDGLGHAIGFAPREAIAGDFLEGASRESFRIAHDISAYSFVALAKAAKPMLEGRQAALLTLTGVSDRLLAAEDDPRRWLEDMERAFVEQPYDGMFTFFSGQELATLRVVHMNINGEPRERLFPMTGAPRLTFNQSFLLEGIDFIPVAIGLFGIAEVLASLERRHEAEPIRTRLRDMWLTTEDWVKCRLSIVRGGVVGLFVGIMPGAGASVASMLAYLLERKVSSTPEKFGSGAIDGVAAAESANNSASHGALIPMLSLGIPGSASTAVLLAALVLHGIRPGPNLMTQEAPLVWGLIASMFIGNVFLLVINLPLAPLFASILRIPYVYLAPAILAISLVGAYAATLSISTVWMCIAFGLLGWLMMKLDVPRAPLVLAVVLAPLLETSLRQALLLSFGSPMIFVERPISAVLLAAIVIALFGPLFARFRRRGSQLPAKP
jgi:hypothetical protein